jgi:hypothetical protein
MLKVVLVAQIVQLQAQQILVKVEMPLTLLAQLMLVAQVLS